MNCRATAFRASAVVAALAAGAATLAPSTPAHADRADAADAGDWMVSQLVGGDHFERFGQPDVGLTIDGALALDETGRYEDTVGAMTAFVADSVADYALPYDDGSYAFTPVGEAAKTATLAVQTGGDPSDFGGADLIGVVEDAIDDQGPLRGRISQDVVVGGQPRPDLDVANTFGQAFAVRALTAASSPEAGAARQFLLAQQCRAGFFRLSFAEQDARDQSCDGARRAVGHVDATAITVIQLASVPGKRVNRAVARAVDWLEGEQRRDGSFVDAAGSSGPNANSTGLAGWALRQEGSTKAARAAGRWIHDRQLLNGRGCPPFARPDIGAIAYNTAAYRAVRGGSISANGDSDQFARATAQALPALLAVPRADRVDPC